MTRLFKKLNRSLKNDLNFLFDRVKTKKFANKTTNAEIGIKIVGITGNRAIITAANICKIKNPEFSSETLNSARGFLCVF